MFILLIFLLAKNFLHILCKYIFYKVPNEANLIFSAFKDSHGISALQKPDKIYLENTNLKYALSGIAVNMGKARETFFANQLKYKHKIELSKQTDFLVDQKYSFEIGGKNKGKSQIENLSDAYIVSDNIEYGFGNKIPLWLFGFLY
jgi:hypothetical protein